MIWSVAPSTPEWPVVGGYRLGREAEGINPETLYAHCYINFIIVSGELDRPEHLAKVLTIACRNGRA